MFSSWWQWAWSRIVVGDDIVALVTSGPSPLATARRRETREKNKPSANADDEVLARAWPRGWRVKKFRVDPGLLERGDPKLNPRKTQCAQWNGAEFARRRRISSPAIECDLRLTISVAKGVERGLLRGRSMVDGGNGGKRARMASIDVY